MRLKVINSGSSGNGYALISEAGEILLLECGVKGIEMKRLIDFQVGNVGGCLLSHSHRDHSGRIKDYLNSGINVYTSDEVASDILTATGEKTVPIPRMQKKKLGSFTVIPFRVPHNGTECDGWLITHKELGRLLFITDAEYCPYDFSKMGITHAMIECNYSEDYIENDAENLSHVLRGHMELQTCKRLIQMIDSPELRSVGLIHLSGQNSDSERFRQEIKEIVDCDVNVWVAEKGFETELSLEPF